MCRSLTIDLFINMWSRSAQIYGDLWRLVYTNNKFYPYCMYLYPVWGYLNHMLFVVVLSLYLLFKRRSE